MGDPWKHTCLQGRLGILAAVAARIENLKHLSRTTPDVDATLHLTQTQVDVAIVLRRTKVFKPGDQLTLQQAVELIAQVGGYTGKSSGGPAGTITIGRGMREVIAAPQPSSFSGRSD